MKNKQLFVQVLGPTNWTCSFFKRMISDRMLEPDIPKVVIIHRNYFRSQPQGARNPRGRDGDFYQNPNHIADFIAWMNRHPAGDINVDWQLNPPGINIDIN